MDTNLWVYLKAQNQSPDDQRKRQIVELLILNLPEIALSAQVLNELANVLMKKFGFTERDIAKFIEEICTEFEVAPLTPAITQKALSLKAFYSLSWFDSLIAAAALLEGCSILTRKTCTTD
ncbi:MAG: PIN domain-containing protein [Saprospiraceae bacterium]|nr:PIN domain-containing protein [Saprospiraceae bacterium]